jgi:DNA-binding MurR/RpiR family transcriptional regulator
MDLTNASLSLAERVAARVDRLSPSELKVATFIRQHAEDVAFLSVNELAQQLGTSDATVVRTAQTLGYAGFPDLRRELIEALRTRVSPALRLGRSLESLGEPTETVLDRALEVQIELLQQARRSVNPDSFVQAVEILVQAKRILAFGMDAAGHLVQTFTLRLQRIGHEALPITASGVSLADALLTMRRGDALVALVYEQGPLEASIVLAEAKARDVPVVLLTDTLAARFADQISVALTASRGDVGTFKTLGTTGVLLDTLLLAIGARERARSLLALEQFDRLRSLLLGSRQPG